MTTAARATGTPTTGVRARVRALLASERAPLVAAALAMVLSLSSLGDGLVSDDRLLWLGATHGMQELLGTRAPWDLFRFYDAEETVLLHRDLGLGPWWASPDLRMSFFRPLSSLTHWVDFHLFPGAPWAMHAENVLLYGLLALAVARLLRRIEGGSVVAGLAAVMYAIDDAHGMPVGWISMRNALLATLFGTLAIERHAYARSLEASPERTRATLVAVGAFGLALLSGEASLGALAYLGSYALVLDRGTLAARARSLAPYLGLVALWAVPYAALGYGARASGMYIDPRGETGDYLLALPERIGMLLQGQLGFPPSDVAMLLPREHIAIWLPLTGVTIVLVALVLWRVLRTDVSARFWALGALVACIPVSATWPSDRLLLFCGIGAFALVARVVVAPLGALAPDAGRLARGGMRAAAGGWLVLHLIVAPLLLPVRVRSVALLLGRAQDRAGATFPDAGGETLVVANAPDWFVIAYGAMDVYLHGRARPELIRLLGVTLAPVAIERTDAHTIVVRPGRPYLEDPVSLAVRRLGTMRAGERIELTGATIVVEELDAAGRPTVVRWTFDRPLDELRWATWEGTGFVAMRPPRIGETVTTPEIDAALAYLAPVE